MTDDKKQVDIPDMIKALRKGKKIYSAFEDALEIADMLSNAAQQTAKLEKEIKELTAEKEQLDKVADVVFANKEEILSEIASLKKDKANVEQALAEKVSAILAEANSKAASIIDTARVTKQKLEEEITSLVRQRNASLKEYENAEASLATLKYQISQEKERIVKALG